MAIAGVDAHAKLALREDDAGDSRYSLPVPGYDASFRVLSVHVRPDSPLTGDAAADAAAVVTAIRAGHLYTAIDGVASPPVFEFTATNGSGTVHEGEYARCRRSRHAARAEQRAGGLLDDCLA